VPTANLPTVPPRSAGLAQAIFLLLLAATMAQMAWYYPRLPERVASHFNAAGEANAFMPKEAFLKLHLMVLGIMSVAFLIVPALITRFPPSMINLPNKDYWLAPERMAQTRATLNRYLVGFGNAMLLFLLLVLRDALRASLMPIPRIPNRIWVFLVLLGVWMILWTVRFVRAFRLPD
jgi:uncharacterized membrane protein